MSAPSPGSCQRLQGDRASQIDAWQRLARLTEVDGNGRKRSKGRVSWSGSKSKCANGERERAGAAGTCRLEAREENEVANQTATWTPLDASPQPRSRATRVVQASLQVIHPSYTLSPSASRCALGRSSSCGHHPLFFFCPRRHCGAPPFQIPK